MNWIMYTVGVVAHIWAILTILNIIVLLNDPKVKYMGAKITLNGYFFVAWIGVLAFWMWFFFG